MSEFGADLRPGPLEAEGGSRTAARASVWRRVRGPGLFAAFGLAVVWVALPRVPAGWGIAFGQPYLVFFSMAVAAAALVFVLLDWGPIRQPESPQMTFASIVLVYLATVGSVTAFGLWYYPQFELPGRAAADAGGAEARGKAVFLDSASACFACHSIEAAGIRGGTRGPDLSQAGRDAAVRKAGLSAEDYLRESIADPWACFTPLPGSGLVECQAVVDPARTYPQMMPPGFRERLGDARLGELVAFLLSLRGPEGRDGERR